MPKVRTAFRAKHWYASRPVRKSAKGVERKRQTQLPSLAPLCLCIWVLAASGCADKDAGATAAGGAGLLGGLRVSQTNANALEWTLRSRAARLEESETRIYFEEPSVTFFEKDRVSSELSADTGFLDLTRENAELAKNVLVVSRAEEMTLKTSRLYFSSEKNKIWTDEEVLILKGRNVTRGRGFTANPDLSEIEISRQETEVNRPAEIKGGRKE